VDIELPVPAFFTPSNITVV